MTHHETSAWQRIRTLFRVFGPYVRPYRRQVGVAYVARGISVAAAALRPWPLKYILGSVILGKSSLGPRWLVAGLCLGMVVIAIVESTAGYFQKLYFARVGHSTTTDVLQETYTHLQTLPRGERKAGSGDLLLRLTSDVKTIRDIVVEHLQK